VTRREWKCWFADESEDGAVDVLGCYTAEQASREFVDQALSGGDYSECVDNYPLTVMVRSDSGSVEKYEVTVETIRQISANRVPGPHEDTE